ncbi:MAG: hypothetical protein GY716_01630 [bacterium]|nr:hypothetical protein [bacterium]
MTLRRPDPRHYQIAVLSTLLLYGTTRLGFDIGIGHVMAAIGGTLATQYVFTRALGLPRFDARSPLISGLSLSLLLRTDALWLVLLGAVLTIGAKFLIRRCGKHVFNPTNFGLVAMMLLTDRAWVSPGQWGGAVWFGFLVACLGGLVVNRSARSDVTWAFLVAYLAVVFGRAVWLGDPLAIPLHQIQNGAFLIFAFFMISDPKTTPDTRAGRVLFALLVALGAGFVHFVLFRTNGLLWSLALCSTAVPLIDRLFPGRRFQWNWSVARNDSALQKGAPA